MERGMRITKRGTIRFTQGDVVRTIDGSHQGTISMLNPITGEAELTSGRTIKLSDLVHVTRRLTRRKEVKACSRTRSSDRCQDHQAFHSARRTMADQVDRQS